jgi:hypothetical protein
VNRKAIMALPTADREFIAQIILQLVQVAGALIWLRRDESRMSKAEQARAWWPATRDLLAFYLGPLAVCLHYARTRRGVRRILYPIATVVCTVLLMLGLQLTLAWVLDLPLE